MTIHQTLRPVGVFAGAAVCLALAACSQGAPEAAKAPVEVAPVAAPAPAVTLPVSLNAVMVGLIDHSSDPIFDIGNGKTPKTDDQWRDVEYHAYQMAVGGKLIQLAGTGPKDAGWVAQAEWKKQADALSAVGMEALKLAQAKDPKGFLEVGNRLVDTCNGCHREFKPEIPTMGILHKPDFPR